MLVSGAASGQDRLAQAAQSSAKTITQLTDVVKLGAASFGADDPETQVSRSVGFVFYSLLWKIELRHGGHISRFKIQGFISHLCLDKTCWRASAGL